MRFSKKKVLIALALVILVLAVAWTVMNYLLAAQNMRKYYKAVFLSDGQVYFGRIEKSPYQGFIRLTDVYYFRIVQNGSVGKMAKGNILQQSGKENSGPQLGLVKLGKEVHGPYNYMDINKDNVLFIEDLKPQSKVVRGIKGFGK